MLTENRHREFWILDRKKTDSKKITEETYLLKVSKGEIEVLSSLSTTNAGLTKEGKGRRGTN